MTAATLSPSLAPSAIIPAAAFKRALDFIARRGIDRTANKSIPILSNAAITADGDAVMVRGTDLDLMIYARIHGAIADASFKTTAPAHLLADIAKKSGGTEFSFELNGPERASVSDGAAQMSLQTLPIINYPDLPFTGDVTAEFELSADEFLAALEQVRPAISTETGRYYLNGIFMHRPERGEFTMVATDGHRLIKRVMGEVKGTKGMPGVIIPHRAIDALCHMLKPVYDGKGKAKVRISPESVRVTVNCVKVRFTFGDYELVTKLIDGTFPDYKRVIPTGNGKVLTVNADELARVVKQVSAMSSERGRAVKFELADDKLIASANNPDGGMASQSIDCLYDAAPLTIGFNGAYVLSILESVPASPHGDVTLWLDECGSPTIFGTSPCNRDVLAVIMPMRV